MTAATCNNASEAMAGGSDRIPWASSSLPETSSVLLTRCRHCHSWHVRTYGDLWISATKAVYQSCVYLYVYLRRSRVRLPVGPGWLTTVDVSRREPQTSRTHLRRSKRFNLFLTELINCLSYRKSYVYMTLAHCIAKRLNKSTCFYSKKEAWLHAHRSINLAGMLKDAEADPEGLVGGE